MFIDEIQLDAMNGGKAAAIKDVILPPGTFDWIAFNITDVFDPLPEDGWEEIVLEVVRDVAVRPPYDRMWIEWHTRATPEATERLERKFGQGSVALVTLDTGVFVRWSTFESTARMVQSEITRAGLSADEDADWKMDFLEHGATHCIIMSFVLRQNHPMLPKTMHAAGMALVPIDIHGHILHSDLMTKREIPILTMIGDSDMTRHSAKLGYDPHVMVADGAYVVLYALGLLHVKNIVPEAHVPSDGAQKARASRNRPPLVTWHTLSVKVPGTKEIVPFMPHEKGDPTMPFHTVRGHYKTWTEERPLFGKLVGTWYVPAHARGSKERGIVVKDYHEEMSV